MGMKLLNLNFSVQSEISVVPLAGLKRSFLCPVIVRGFLRRLWDRGAAEVDTLCCH